MAEFVFSLILAIVQAITEWIPVSSSGHIVLFEEILGYEGGIVFNIGLHFGTLLAVLVYFYKDVAKILHGFFRFDFKSEGGKMGLMLLLGTIPVVVIGLLFFEEIGELFSGLGIVVLGFGITGLFLIISSFDLHSGVHRVNGYWKALLIGLAQVIAVVPGISRSGMTMASGMLLGIEEKEAMRFSFLLSIPVIFGAGLLALMKYGDAITGEIILSSLVAFVLSLGTIHLLFTKILRDKKNMRWFGAYALLLALVIWIWLV